MNNEIISLVLFERTGHFNWSNLLTQAPRKVSYPFTVISKDKDILWEQAIDRDKSFTEFCEPQLFMP